MVEVDNSKLERLQNTKITTDVRMLDSATMTGERLNGLVLANINKDDIDFEDIEKYILPAFLKRSPRRIQTLDWTK
ncbi:zinc finger MYM-type protein 1-like [Aphis craccivora]|uniref:Zinc finger MYM-type protein 1-like n=1 Tax=Aphis craccivora TaxID=307492 RepID=A0A6G0YAX9_APHCR|nr:zinc finger MYM-type protein 1-like [Aphis craccivora]